MTIPSKPTDSDELALRKQQHIDLTFKSKISREMVDARFDYEPLFFSHPTTQDKWPTTFLNSELDYPLWISSMTGGGSQSKVINVNLARLCGEYKLGMGLGSCRSLLENPTRLEDFSVRKYLGHQPLMANVGLAQVEELVLNDQIGRIHELVKMLEADGLIIHLNPLQEWFQPEGDRFKQSPFLTLTKFLEKTLYPVFVKEVGQGMGPQSLKALLGLPLAGIEFGAFGGTNFSQLESLRGESSAVKNPYIQVGHTALEMVKILNALPIGDKEFVISGGIQNVLDGYELKMKFKGPSVLGMASSFLNPALNGYEALQKHFLELRESLLVAKSVLHLKENQ